MVSRNYERMKRALDVLNASLAMAAFGIPMIAIGLLIRATSQGPALHWSKRVGRDNRIFLMAKFRSMRIDSPQVATHLLNDPQKFVTPIGKFLRKYSIDELPQLYNILAGDISVVGPRPALFNQDDLVALRTAKGIHRIIPGLTGWAQVNGRDELPIPVKVQFDEHYLHHRSIVFDIKIILKTVLDVFRSSGVSH